MHHVDVAQVLGILAALLAAAKLFGTLARRMGQPAVLGELVAGVLVGSSVLGLVDLQDATDARNDVFHVFSEIGVVLLLFEIGLETDLVKLLRLGGVSAVVALVGVALPFVLGFGVCRLLGHDHVVAVVAGAAMTATSVGITARVLADLGRLQDPESQIILGAAVLDDVIGLVILAVVAGMVKGQAVTAPGVAWIAAIAFGFLIATIVLGRFITPLLFRLNCRSELLGTPTMLAVILALALAWLAQVAGSAVIIGAFAGGLLVRALPQADEIERGVAHLGHFFVPLFFVIVGAGVDVRVFNPAIPANWPIIGAGSLLILAAIAGKFAAGYAPFWFRGRKVVIGVGMIPRGEVGLIFAQMGLTTGVFDAGFFSAVTLMVMVTTLAVPPLLKMLLPRRPGTASAPPPEGIEDLVTQP